MKNRFEKYETYIWKNGKIVGFNDTVFVSNIDEAFELFKDLFDHTYGTIKEDENLISIHSGGWSENELLIREFKQTYWWFKFHQITGRGGHYYFNTDTEKEKEWEIIVNNVHIKEK